MSKRNKKKKRNRKTKEKTPKVRYRPAFGFWYSGAEGEKIVVRDWRIDHLIEDEPEWE